MFSAADLKYKKLLLFMPKENLDTQLRLQLGNLLYKIDNNKMDKVPLYNLFAIFLVGRFMLSSQLLRSLLEHGVSVYFLTNNFELYTECVAETKANYLLRQKQYFLTEIKEFSLAKQLTLYKMENQNSTLKYFNKTLINIPAIEFLVNTQSLLGVEGSASALYFSYLFDKMNWYKRLPQVHPDKINLLMDVGYMMLFNLTDAFLSLFGFDTYKGFYHKLFFARKSLACDIMEPVRPLIDAAIITMHYRNILKSEDFEIRNKSYEFSGDYSKRLKYFTYFTKTLSLYKEELFQYIRQFYFAISLPEKYEFKNIQLDLSKLPQKI
jgi:CRISPR-associated protein Cas1